MIYALHIGESDITFNSTQAMSEMNIYNKPENSAMVRGELCRGKTSDDFAKKILEVILFGRSRGG